MEIRVSQNRGLRNAVHYFEGMARRARNLIPLKEKVRNNWAEAERRALDSHGASAGEPWPARRPSTLLRYRWPISHRVATDVGEGTGHFTGLMARTLTHPHLPGVRDDVTTIGGELRANFSIDPGGPIAHARHFAGGGGARAPRNLIVWDRIADRDTARDAEAHIAKEDR